MPPALMISHSILAIELTDALAEQAGRRISVVCQPQGGRRARLEMAEKSAELSLMYRFSERGSQQARMCVLAGTAGIDLGDLAALRVERFDISHTADEVTQASCVVFHSHVM